MKKIYDNEIPKYKKKKVKQIKNQIININTNNVCFTSKKQMTTCLLITILDNCMESGSTGVACKNLNRRFIGIELNSETFNLAKDRIEGVDN